MGSKACFVQRYSMCLFPNFSCNDVFILPSCVHDGDGGDFPSQGHNSARQRRLQAEDAGDDFAYGNFTRSSEIVLVKSSSEIELKYIEYLSALSKRKMVCTGPLIVDGHDCNETESLEIMKWLNGKDFNSTIYLSFGSECFLSKKHIAEIAKGLQICDDVNFLWVMRFPVDELPRGFIASGVNVGATDQDFRPWECWWLCESLWVELCGGSYVFWCSDYSPADECWVALKCASGGGDGRGGRGWRRMGMECMWEKRWQRQSVR